MFASNPPVLLARPHPFLEDVMGRFLVACGFGPAVVAKLDNLRPEDLRRFQGAVISTSVLSQIKERYQDVVQRLRVLDPTLPLIFATLAPLDVMAAKLEKDLQRLDEANKLYSRLDLDSLDLALLGGTRTFLLLHKDDLVETGTPKRFEGLIQRHFRQRR